MNAERKFLCLSYFCAGHLRYPRFRFIRSAHRFTPLTDTHPPERIFGYSLYILLFIIATLLLLPGSILVIAGGIVLARS